MRHKFTFMFPVSLILALATELFASTQDNRPLSPDKSPISLSFWLTILRIGNVGVYGADKFKTPNIDQLAAGGFGFCASTRNPYAVQRGQNT